MPITQVMQSSLATGVIAPTVAGRVDVLRYYSALSIGKNITLMPHGGAKRRAGSIPVLKSKDPSLGYSENEIYFTNNIRLEPFVFNVDQKYLVIYDLTEIKIFKHDLLIHSLSTTTEHTFTKEQLKKMDVIQYGDTMIIVHPDFAPLKLMRGSTETDWTLSKIPFENVPMFDYSKHVVGKKETFKGDGSTKKYILIYTIPFFTVYLDGVKQTEAQVPYDKEVGKITFATAPANGAKIEVISGAGVSANYATHSYEPLWSDTRGFPRTVTIHQSRLYFGGTRSKPVTVVGSVVNDYFNFELGNGEPDMGIFNTIASGTFDDIVNLSSGRGLVLNTESGEYHNPSTPITPATSSWRRQTAYGGTRVGTAQIDGSIYFVDRSGSGFRQFIYSNDEDGYISPNVGLLANHIIHNIQRVAVSKGSKGEIANLIYVVNSDGTMAVLNTMRSENILGWSQWTTKGEYLDVVVVDETVYTLVHRGFDGAGEPKNYIEIVDDTVLMDHYWSAGKGVEEFISDGIEKIYQLTLTTSGNILVYLDGVEMTDQPFYDSTKNRIIFKTPPPVMTKISVIPTTTGFNVLQLPTSAYENWGKASKKGNYYYEGESMPTKNGLHFELTFDEESVFLESGFNFDVHIRTMNLNKNLQQGSIINARKRLVRVKLNLLNTLGIKVNDYRISDKKFIMSFNGQIIPFTGVKDIYLLGWADHHHIDITQEIPEPFTILQIETEIKY